MEVADAWLFAFLGVKFKKTPNIYGINNWKNDIKVVHGDS